MKRNSLKSVCNWYLLICRICLLELSLLINDAKAADKLYKFRFLVFRLLWIIVKKTVTLMRLGIQLVHLNIVIW